MLAEAGLALLALCAMDKGGLFSIEAVQTIGMFVNKGIILRNKLPADFGRNDVLMNGGRRRGIGHCKLGNVSAGGGRARRRTED